MAEGDASFATVAKKRWRAWLRSVHRDFGYVSVGFTFIYAISGIAQNHLEEWGDISFSYVETTSKIAPIPETLPDAAAIAQVTAAAARGTPSETFRAGDEVRLTFPDGSKVSAIGTTLTLQHRKLRPFIGVANWLHRARGKPAWKYISDIYALMLLYLSISGLLLIKGKLGFKWRGAALLVAGVCVPVVYVGLSGGPESSPIVDDAAKPKVAATLPAPPPQPAGSGSGSASAAGSAVLVPLAPDPNDD
jgi:hypothetical protein